MSRFRQTQSRCKKINPGTPDLIHLNSINRLFPKNPTSVTKTEKRRKNNLSRSKLFPNYRKSKNYRQNQKPTSIKPLDCSTHCKSSNCTETVTRNTKNSLLPKRNTKKKIYIYPKQRRLI